MTPTTLTERVRHWIHQALAQATGQEEATMETLLIREGFFCGRRFVRGEHQAVWFIEEDEIKVFGPEGQVLESHVASELAEEIAAEPPAAAEQKKAA